MADRDRRPATHRRSASICPSCVNGGYMRRMRRLANCLQHRRMRVNRANELFDGALEAQRERGFCDELRRARSDLMNAEHLVVLRFGDDLHESFYLAGDPRAAEAPER